MRRSILLLPFCLVATMLAGCGQKGPLVMPTRPASASSTAKPPAPVVPPPATDQY